MDPSTLERVQVLPGHKAWERGASLWNLYGWLSFHLPLILRENLASENPNYSTCELSSSAKNPTNKLWLIGHITHLNK